MRPGSVCSPASGNQALRRGCREVELGLEDPVLRSGVVPIDRDDHLTGVAIGVEVELTNDRLVLDGWIDSCRAKLLAERLVVRRVNSSPEGGEGEPRPSGAHPAVAGRVLPVSGLVLRVEVGLAGVVTDC